ncbi:MAG: translation factor Sua5 [Ignavibacteria bacterium]|nr:translation factor Sua5 [Ignavibacteria bacterium]
MKTEIIIPEKKYKTALQQSAAILKSGGIIAFPTDTVYGIGCIASNKKSINRIYELKNRKYDKPLALYFSDISSINDYVTEIPDPFYLLAEIYLPGALTIILKAKDEITSLINSKNGTVAVRIPAQAFLLDLIRELGEPIAGTSANLSSKPAALNLQEAKDYFDGAIEGIIDGGEAQLGMESTIVDLSSGKINILREGAISLGY